MKRLDDLLKGQNPSYLTPLFWTHGEEESVMRHMIGQMHDNGVGEFVIESRPHPDFMGPQWWSDVDIILDEARKRGMKAWFFDDRKFPSGYAAGIIKEKYPQYLKIYLKEGHIDAVGPQFDSYIFTDAWLEEEGEELVAVVAARRTDGLDGIDFDSFVDLTDRVTDGVLLWDVPDGRWRIFLFVSTRFGGEGETKDYLNPLEPEPVQVFLNHVYEAHYAHYKDDFGKTIAGFFSDEARFGNAESYDLILGCTSGCNANSRPKIVLPWSRRLLQQLSQRWGGDFRKVLPCLWFDADARTADVRFTYMDLVSSLFADNYTQQIGDWCRAHNVKYIGHLIEENGAHARVGYGAGHFFRSIRGQDYPGLDLIHQVWPGAIEGRFTSQVGYLDSDFFYWGITKMASSAAHITSCDSGKTICEIFGAYGWQAGLKMMKWLTDHICVRGVNLLVPHAFSPKACDWDAPPHFYDRGLNPQWRYFHIWSRYANRVCHLLNGGTHVATAAVLYHAEAEWAGKCMAFEKPVKTLAQQQIDCDIIPVDSFTQGQVQVQPGAFCVGGETYRVMVVPYAERLPEGMLLALKNLADAQVPVFFMDDYPASAPHPTPNTPLLLDALRSHNCVQVCSCQELPQKLMAMGLYDIKLSTLETFLRIYHYSHSDGQVYFMTNEAVAQPVHTQLTVTGSGIPVFYDAMENTLELPAFTQNGQALTVSLDLDPHQSCFMILFSNQDALQHFQNTVTGAAAAPMIHGYAGQPLTAQLPNDGWQVSVSKAPQVDVFTPHPQVSTLGNITVPGDLLYFTGTVRYEREFAVDQLPKSLVLDLGRVYETAELWINGQKVGSRICPPYSFFVDSYLRPGVNTIRVDVTNTLAKERGQNLLDRDMIQEPSGLIGPVRLFAAE